MIVTLKALRRLRTSSSMASGLVDILMSFMLCVSLYLFATLRSSICLSFSIAVKLPPKKAISMSIFSSMVLRASLITDSASSGPTVDVTPVILFWLQKMQSFGHPL